jgi:hypothetical protein
MREIKSGDTVLRIRASSLAIFLYKQEFKADIMRDFSQICETFTKSKAMTSKKPDIAEFLSIVPDSNNFMQIVWALNKAQNVAEKLPTPRFEEWIEKYDLSVLDIMTEVISECMHGFFRIDPPRQSGGHELDG